MSILCQRFVVTDLEENTYIVWEEDTGEAVVIDPGGEAEMLSAFLRDRNLKVSRILNTHGHCDHVSANAALRRLTGAPIGIHPLDAPMLSSRLLSLAGWVGWPYEEHEHDFLLHPGEQVGSGSLTFSISHTPGHSPGSVSLYLEREELLFSGDLVFSGGVGRWDLPGGSEKQLFTSIREHFLTLPDSTRVMPGHGPATTVGKERSTNPYLPSGGGPSGLGS